MSIHFCWDSVIDKKVYETWITLAGDVWKLMLTPYSPPGGGSEKYYLRYLLIGLAPEGKIVGQWRDNLRVGVLSFNKAKNPPMSIHFCWDSVIDKKVYETWITLAGEVWKLMLTLYSPPGGGSEKYYLRYLLIGLAPEGKIGVWLEKPDKPNIRLTDKQILIETVSGEKMEMCNGRSAYKHGYSYPESTKNFIKDKKYPYGNW